MIDVTLTQKIRVGNKRLLKLAKFLETEISPKNFDLDHIANDSKNKVNDGKEFNCAIKERTCGTTACAIGSMPIVFPRKFKYIVDINHYDGNREISIQDKETDDIDFDAAKEFFFIDTNTSEQLFMPESYANGQRGPKNVAKKIRNFVKLRERLVEVKELDKGFGIVESLLEDMSYPY